MSETERPALPAEVIARWRAAEAVPVVPPAPAAGEIGGPEGPEPTRYGDWERAGRCVDF